MKNLNQHNWSPGRNLNPGPPKYGAEVLTTQSQYSVATLLLSASAAAPFRWLEECLSHSELPLSEMSHSIFPGETAPEHPGEICGTYPEADLHCRDGAKKDMILKNGHYFFKFSFHSRFTLHSPTQLLLNLNHLSLNASSAKKLALLLYKIDS
jgi:CHASE1-domain containing sensor protein